MTILPISREAHATKRLRPITDFAFAAAAIVVPIYGREIGAVAQELPVAFMAEAEGYFASALMGLRPGQNLMIDEKGRYMGSHIPLAWRRGAFRLARQDGETGKLVLCLDDSSPQIDDTEGEALFGPDGAPSEFLQNISRFLGQLEQDRMQTLRACAALDRMGLLTPWELAVDRGDGQQQRYAGLFRIDEPAIAKLSGENLAELRDIGALPMLYAHLMSQSRVALLARIARHRDERDRQQNALRQGSVDLDRAFGIVEDDPFTF